MEPKIVEVDGTKYIAADSNNLPIFVDKDGKEQSINVPNMNTRITELNGEAMRHREAKEAAEARIKDFGDLDPVAAKDALEKVKSLSAGDLKNAEEVEKIRTEAVAAATSQFQTQIDELTKDRDGLKGSLQNERLSNQFKGSKFIADNMSVPADIVQARFRENFKYSEEGKLQVIDNNGNPIYSKESPGSPADFEEGLSILVEQYPYKDDIMKSTENRGSNSQQNNQGNQGGAKKMSRTEFDKLDPAERSAKMGEGYTLYDE